MKNRNFVLVCAGLFCLAATGVWYTSVSGMVRAEEEGMSTSARPVPTAVAAASSMTPVRSFPGTVRASSRVELAFSVDGLLNELDAVEGTTVRKGDVVARLDPRDAKNSYEAAKARYEIAKKDLDRSRQLLDRKVIPQAEFDTAETNYDVAAAEMRIRKKALDDTILSAPFDGVVSRRYVENFQHIKAKDNILSLKDISRIDVVVQVPERLISQGGNKNFTDVQVRFDSLPDTWYGAKIKEYSIESDPVTRTYEIVVSLDPPENLDIFPGMTATVAAPMNREEAVSLSAGGIVVPLAAVVGNPDNTSYVWVVPSRGGNPVKKAVEIGRIKREGIEITAGLLGGERVAVAGVHSLRADMLVRPANDNREGLDQ